MAFPKRTANLPWREIDDHIVVLSPKTGTIHELNPVAAFLWKQSDGTKDCTALSAAVADRYEIDSCIAEHDVEHFFKELGQLNLVTWENNVHPE